MQVYIMNIRMHVNFFNAIVDIILRILSKTN
jgi:hypothetical protein